MFRYFSPYPLTETEGDEHHPHPYSLSHMHAHAHRSATPTSISAPSHRGGSRASSVRASASTSISAALSRSNTAAAAQSISSGPHLATAAALTGTGGKRIPGVARSSIRSHGRTSDLLAGGLGRNHAAALWVCDRCFKYMAEGGSWELHVVCLSRQVCVSASTNCFLV